MNDLPKLTKKDYMVLENIRMQNMRAFNSNVTSFYLQEMYNYIKGKRVWRTSIMGETRSGKSEVGSTIGITYTKYFNKLLLQGHFDDLDLFVKDKFSKNELNFKVYNVCANQSVYIQRLRESLKTKKLSFGQIWQIDERKDKIGGLGSFSEQLELKNINNIIAKFMQSEIWISPDQLENRNAPYGLYCYQKDEVNRVNWCLLYKIDRTVSLGINYTFMGWVKIPLHKNVKFRSDYNDAKDEWINREIEGSSDERMSLRKKTSVLLSKDEFFSKGHFSDNGNFVFSLSKSQQISILEDYILDGKSQKWNELEMFRIIDEARMIVLKEAITDGK